MEFEVVSWENFYQLTLELVDKVLKSGYNPDVIVGISRGGLVPLRIFSDEFEDVEIGVIRVVFYEDVKKTGSEPKIIQDVNVNVAGRRVLIVDDVADTGRSLETVRNHIQSKGALSVKIATVYYKPWSILKPDYYVKKTEKWIIFPHEIGETIRKLAKRELKEGGKTVEEFREMLIDIGLPPMIVDNYLRRIKPEGL
ncbi:MAG: phosphoribosyltransferase [Thermoproteota archaeon]|nr:phosphoribosyltransferase [Candidatus Brockarchaeota archaeon]